VSGEQWPLGRVPEPIYVEVTPTKILSYDSRRKNDDTWRKLTTKYDIET
jgi:hypothetical protein